MSQVNIPIVLIIHEAPYNPTSPITLISEYQARDYGTIIDSVSTRHKTIHGTYGTQRMVLSPYVYAPFVDRGGLMGLEILPWESGHHGTYGTQRMVLSPDVYAPFVDRGGLMGLEILPWESGDEERYDVFTITSEQKWTPRRYIEDSPLHSSPGREIHTTSQGEDRFLDAIQDLGEDDSVKKGEAIVNPNVEIQEGFQPNNPISPLTLTMDGTSNLPPIMNDIYPMLPFEDTPDLYHYDPTDVGKPTVGHTVYRLLSVPP